MDESSENAVRDDALLVRRIDCPLCSTLDLFEILAFDTPVMCNVLFPERQVARDADRGRLTLAYCQNCSHVFNSTYQENKVCYTPNYNSSLEHSAHFRAFAAALTDRLNTSYKLLGKTIVEIGCGKGDFLNRLCTVADAQGVGFDTSVDDQWMPSSSKVRFIRDYFGESYTDVRPDLLIGRHVLEHIGKPVAFLESLRSHPSISPETVFYFETPNGLYTLRDHGIWDLIYEHISYFTEASLSMAFELAEFEVLDVGTSFSDQYVYVEARRGPARKPNATRNSEDIKALAATFREIYHHKIDRWAQYVSTHGAGETVVWGAGSKGITFVNEIRQGETATSMSRIGSVIAAPGGPAVVRAAFLAP
jgi:2-polyprenyl-3-methyl-5-hydroxy-6-metoxy-1,4-benzoquinol methylase